MPPTSSNNICPPRSIRQISDDIWLGDIIKEIQGSNASTIASYLQEISLPNHPYVWCWIFALRKNETKFFGEILESIDYFCFPLDYYIGEENYLHYLLIRCSELGKYDIFYQIIKNFKVFLDYHLTNLVHDLVRKKIVKNIANTLFHIKEIFFYENCYSHIVNFIISLAIQVRKTSLALELIQREYEENPVLDFKTYLNDSIKSNQTRFVYDLLSILPYTIDWVELTQEWDKDSSTSPEMSKILKQFYESFSNSFSSLRREKIFSLRP